MYLCPRCRQVVAGLCLCAAFATVVPTIIPDVKELFTPPHLHYHDPEPTGPQTNKIEAVLMSTTVIAVNAVIISTPPGSKKPDSG